MPSVIYKEPTGRTIEDPGLDYLQTVILDPPDTYWKQGNGGATLDYRATDGKTTTLLILPNESYGIYLKYFDEDEEEWISLQDPQQLAEVVECADHWYASVGLFLPKEKAWLSQKRRITLKEIRSCSVPK